MRNFMNNITKNNRMKKSNHQYALRLALATSLFTAALANVNVAQAQTLEQLTFGPQEEQRGQRLDGIVAFVGNDVITLKEFEAIGKDKAKLERLIMRKLLVQMAKSHNLAVGDTALNIAIDKLKAKGKRVAREVLREELLIQKLQQQVVNSLVKISDQEVNTAVERELKQVGGSVHLVDILVPVPQSADSDTLNAAKEKTQRMLKALKTKDNPQAVASANGARYSDLGWVDLAQIPSSFSQALIDAPANAYLKPLVDRDGVHLIKVLARKMGKVQAVKIPETRVSHILIKADTPDAKARIDELYQQLQRGADFAELAKLHSQDRGSAVNGGDLAWVVPGKMVADFEAVMDQTPVGKISRPFKSQFGYHILKVDQRRQRESSSKDALIQQARQKIFAQKAEEEWELWLTQLRDESHVRIVQ